MSYNLLLDTKLSKIDKHWKLTNCIYENGYLISNANIFSIEQEIILPDPTKLYFGLDYICLDKNIKFIYCGIQINNILEANKKIPRLHKRKRISVVDNSKGAEKIKVIFICETVKPGSKIYIDSPLLVNLSYHDKDWLPRWYLNKTLDYRYGYNYENCYSKGCEIQLDNEDFTSAGTKTEQGEIGIICHVKKHDWFRLTHNFIPDRYYLIKLDFEEINNYGYISASYGETNANLIKNDQLYIIFKANASDTFKIFLDNEEELPYLINLKRILVIDLTNLKIDEDDIIHLPFI